jgi:hypothetical protein
VQETLYLAWLKAGQGFKSVNALLKQARNTRWKEVEQLTDFRCIECFESYDPPGVEVFAITKTAGWDDSAWSLVE